MKQITKEMKHGIALFNAIESRLEELWNKLIEGRYNQATQYAFTVGFISDLENEYRKIIKKEHLHPPSFPVKK